MEYNLDFSYAGQTREPEKFDYIHRVDGQSEIYFVINRTGNTEVGDFSFRVTGKQPEIWDPVTGEMKEAGSFEQKDGLTGLSLELAPYGSCFIVFRKSISKNSSGKGIPNFLKYEEDQKS